MEPKSVFASTTNWAALIAAAAALLPLFGFTLGTGASEQVATAVGATTVAAAAVWIVVERLRKGDLFIRVPKP